MSLPQPIKVRHLLLVEHLTLANLFRQVSLVYAGAGQRMKAVQFNEAADKHATEVTYLTTGARPNDIDTPD